MNVLENIIYGIISGFSEFLPISSLGHQQLLKLFFGGSSPEPLRDIFVHIAFLVAVLLSCGTYIENLRREIQQKQRIGKRRSGQRERRFFYDTALLRGTTLIMLLGMVVLRIIFRASLSLSWIAFGFLLNGIMVFIPEYLPHGNKDARSMSGFDSLLLGLGSALSVLPGFSRVGIFLSAAVFRGADKVKAYNWALVLTIPSVLIFLIFDIITVFQFGLGMAGFISFLGYLLSGIFAFVSSLAGIYLIRFMLVRSGFAGFAFYCWGAAFLSFLLHLSA